MKKFVGSVACALLMLVSYSASAKLVTFDFRKPNGTDYYSTGYTSGSRTFYSTDGNHTVEASAWSQRGTPYMASSRNYGLYVYTCENGCNDNTHEIDGKGPNEGIKLDFGQEAKIKFATFSYVDRDGTDDFTLYVDGQKELDDVYLGRNFWSTYYFQDDFYGNVFKFLADGKYDDFKLKKVGVHIVPIPAAVWLFSTALAALGLVARRRQQAVA